jgi:ribosomal protein L40E
MKICKKCGEINQAETKYCVSCGSDAFVFSVDFNCPFCGAPNDKASTHCTNCGNPISFKQEPAVVHEAPAPAPVPAPIRGAAVNVYGDNGELVESAAKETVACPCCGAELSITAIYCPICGEMVAKMHQHRVLKRRVCRQCGTPNAPENPFCTYCYQSLSDATNEEFQLVHKSVQLSSGTVKVAQLHGNSADYHICNNCGALTAVGKDFCSQCGQKLVVEEQKRYCVNCGFENAPEAKFCMKCQWSFEGDLPNKDKPMWVCPHCDAHNDHDNLYCIKCGSKKG